MKCEKPQKCSIDKVVGIIGNKGNLFIIWHLRTGVLRFTESPEPDVQREFQDDHQASPRSGRARDHRP